MTVDVGMTMGDRILVVDDEVVLRDNLAKYLRMQGYEVDTASSAEEALEHVQRSAYVLVITDQRMPGMDGLTLIGRLRDLQPSALTLLITAYASFDAAIEALRVGAADYLLKPVQLAEVGRKVAGLLRTRQLGETVRRLRQELAARSGAVDLVGHSAAMARVEHLVGRLAATPANVLVLGETGSGKELVARALHERSDRADRDFLPVNLAAQPADLVDAMLFGHAKGAFTGASGQRDGVFRSARGGTVFLDEVGELPVEVQAKLLRVIENREVQPLGADRPEKVDFRLIAATHRSLSDMVKAGTFREDLFFRLEVVRIEVPPLRERVADLPELARRLLERHARSLGRAPPRLTHDALTALRTHTWPGNVRELSNVLERAVLLGDGPWVEVDDLPTFADASPRSTLLKPALESFERAHIRRVLDLNGGDKKATATDLGVHLATLYRHLERLGLSTEG